MSSTKKRLSTTDKTENLTALAVTVARLYYHQGLGTEEIAKELNLSRPKISRLLSLAKKSGIVEIRIHDPEARPKSLATQLKERYPFLSAHVVSVPVGSSESVWFSRVVVAAANLLSEHVRSGQVVGLAWGNTIDAISHALTPKHVGNLQFVQLNGSANAVDFMNGFVTETITRFAQNFGARAHLFPVPTFFDSSDTRTAMWRERSVRNVLDIQSQSDILLYSIGSPTARSPSYVYASSFLDANDFKELHQQQVIGDIATVFFRADGSYADIPMNRRASGPDLALTQTAKHSICVVSGLGKIDALRSALNGRLLNVLVIDEITARELLNTAN